MAISTVSDELKSDIVSIKYPITKDLIIKTINGIIYSLKNNGLLYKENLNKPGDGVNWLTFYKNNNIYITSNSQNEINELIKNLIYLNVPLTIKDVIDVINLIIKILQYNKENIVSSYDFEIFKKDFYDNSLENNNVSELPNYNNDILSKIESLNKISIPITSGNLINEINIIVNIFKNNSRLVFIKDFQNLITYLETLEINLIDYGSSNSVYTNDDKLDYGNSTMINNEQI